MENTMSSMCITNLNTNQRLIHFGPNSRKNLLSLFINIFLYLSFNKKYLYSTNSCTCVHLVVQLGPNLFCYILQLQQQLFENHTIWGWGRSRPQGNWISDWIQYTTKMLNKFPNLFRWNNENILKSYNIRYTQG